MPLQKRNPAIEAARQTIRTAFEDLEKAISPTDLRELKDVTLQDVQKAVLDLENQLGKRTSLRNIRRLEPLFTGLGYYSTIIEVLCNGTPYLSWLWAPLKLILKVSSDYVDAFEHIIKAYSKIAECLPRFQILGQTFSGIINFQQTLAGYYANIVRFHKKAYGFVRRSCWKVLFISSWGRFQRRFGDILDDMKRLEKQIEKEANVHHMAGAQVARQDLEILRQESLARLAREEQEQSASQLQAISTWLKLDETDQAAIFDKISTEGSEYDGTCGWILKNTVVASWLRTQLDTYFVWLQGSPGSGKSVLAGQLVNFLRKSMRNPLVITHFCSCTHASSIQYDKILRSLIFQLLHASEDLIGHIYREYVVGKNLASVPLLEQLFSLAANTVLGDPGRTHAIHIVLDGIEDLDPDKQRRLVNLMVKTKSGARANSGVCKVLVSCRTTRLLEKLLGRKSIVTLSDEKSSLEEAISIYASARLRANTSRWSQLGLRELDMDNISRSIAIKADGMFLWARLVLDYIASNMFYKREEIIAAIETLPRELSKFYERILTNIISSFDKRSKERLVTILGWIAFAKRPLRKFEFLSALSFSSGDHDIDVLVPPFVFDMCAPVIEQRRDTSFAFIHGSVKEYLQSGDSLVPLTKEIAIREQCVASMTCLLSGLQVFQPVYSEESRRQRVLKGLFGFYAYADRFWVDTLLGFVKSYGHLSQHPSLATIAEAISSKLRSIYGISNETFGQDVEDEGDLGLLKEYEGIYTSAKAVLAARSDKKFGHLTRKNDLISIQELPDVFANFQTTIETLLQIHGFPGVSREEISLFQTNFSSLAYTCRFPSCLRDTVGFENNHSRLEHEATHTQSLKCLYPRCQFLSFSSARSLRNHEISLHEKIQVKRTIRRVDRSGSNSSRAHYPVSAAPGTTTSSPLGNLCTEGIFNLLSQEEKEFVGSDYNKLLYSTFRFGSATGCYGGESFNDAPSLLGVHNIAINWPRRIEINALDSVFSKIVISVRLVYYQLELVHGSEGLMTKNLVLDLEQDERINRIRMGKGSSVEGLKGIEFVEVFTSLGRCAKVGNENGTLVVEEHSPYDGRTGLKGFFGMTGAVLHSLGPIWG
ncbi:hypothetical protein TWF696_002349 [Orbilia brochopaga]|uniref:NACHT domain-containing protein n=1 Tax=Orbilia brochopaga TaxID=3140254 RepID=A0AAV9U4Y3_9PEZI